MPVPAFFKLEDTVDGIPAALVIIYFPVVWTCVVAVTSLKCPTLFTAFILCLAFYLYDQFPLQYKPGIAQQTLLLAVLLLDILANGQGYHPNQISYHGQQSHINSANHGVGANAHGTLAEKYCFCTGAQTLRHLETKLKPIPNAPHSGPKPSIMQGECRVDLWNGH